MQRADLADLTTLLDTYNYDNEDFITPQSIHTTWWPSLNKLRQAPNKEALLEGWKYKADLLNVEYSHANGYTDDWEQRFVVAMWLSIYH